MTPNRDPVVIGLDCSTHGSKAIAWSARGDAVAQADAPFPLDNPRPGWWEQSATNWLDTTLSVLERLNQEVGPRVEAISITHQRETFVGVDHSATPVRPAIVWMDERAHDDVELLRSTLGAKSFHEITGKPLSMTPSITKMSWVRRNEPAAFRSVSRWLDVQAFLVRHLTGEDVTSIGSAGPMGVVDLGKGEYAEAVLVAAGIERTTLPRLVPGGTVAGTLTSKISKMTGLGRVPVVVTAGDGQVAALGAGIDSLRHAYLNLGTAIVAGTVSHSMMIDEAFRTMSGAASGTFLLESDLKGGTFTLDWLRERLLGNAVPIEELEREARLVPAGSGGLVLVPYFAGVMDPYWDDDASGVLLGLRGDHGRAHLLRAIMEGIAFEERLHLSRIETATGTNLEEVRVLGGGATSELWCQILADVLDRPLMTTRSREATSLGAAMLAGCAVGWFASVSDAVQSMSGQGRTFEPGPERERYAELFERVFVDVYSSLRRAMGELSRWSRRENRR